MPLILAGVLCVSSLVTLEKADATSTSKSIFTGKTYTHQTMFDGMKIYNGVDVSKWQASIDWKKAKKAGVDFAFIRLGYRGNSSSAALVEDNYFDTNMTNAIAAGVACGAYFYTEAINTTEAVAEANFCVQQLKSYKVTMPVAIDFERYSSSDAGRNIKAGLTTKQYTAIVSAFCDVISANGYTPAIYANSSDLQTYLDGKGLAESYHIWLAKYNTCSSTGSAPYSNKYSFWQYSSTGTVNGISGGVDCNFFYSSTDLSEALVKPGSAKSIAGGTVSTIKDKAYTGSAIKPSVTLKVGGVKLKKGTDYKVSYSNNTNSGIAKITLKGKGDYTGKKVVKFKILPTKVSKFWATANNKKINVKWKKVAGIVGYELYKKSQYNGKFVLVKDITDLSTVKYSDTTITKFNNYRYRIRTYAMNGKKKMYSKYRKLEKVALKGDRVAKSTKKVVLMTKPVKGTKVVTIKKNTAVDLLGIETYKNGKQYIWASYTKGKKTYTGYVLKDKTFKISKKVVATANEETKTTDSKKTTTTTTTTVTTK